MARIGRPQEQVLTLSDIERDELERLGRSQSASVSQINRAAAEVQKQTSEEEGFAPVLAWVKALVDEVLAREFADPATGSADIEFAWTPTDTVDPVAQEQMLASYTSRGILTLNEARAALGRDPLADPAADRPMALTTTGYVALGQTAPAAGAKGLGKADDWDETQHPRWPSGSPDSQGGRFVPGLVGSSGTVPQPVPRTTPTDRKQVAEVVPICIRGYNRTRVSNGITHFYAEYHCPDGRVIDLFSIGQPLKGFIRQPP